MDDDSQGLGLPRLQATFHQPTQEQVQAMLARQMRLAQVQLRAQQLAAGVDLKPEATTVGAQQLQLQPAGRPPCPTSYSLSDLEALNAQYIRQHRAPSSSRPPSVASPSLVQGASSGSRCMDALRDLDTTARVHRWGYCWHPTVDAVSRRGRKLLPSDGRFTQCDNNSRFTTQPG